MKKAQFTAMALLSFPFVLTAQETRPPVRLNVEAAKTIVKNVDPAGAKKVLDEATAKKESPVKVLDIRTPAEFKDGCIAGAVNIDILSGDFADKAAALDKSATYLLYCASGRRSTKSLETLQKQGFRSIVHLDGGFTAWQKAGLPVEKTK